MATSSPDWRVVPSSPGSPLTQSAELTITAAKLSPYRSVSNPPSCESVVPTPTSTDVLEVPAASLALAKKRTVTSTFPRSPTASSYWANPGTTLTPAPPASAGRPALCTRAPKCSPCPAFSFYAMLSPSGTLPAFSKAGPTPPSPNSVKSRLAEQAAHWQPWA